MSGLEYLNKFRDWRAPVERVDENGVRFVGPVLTGGGVADGAREAAGDEEVYGRVADYDPVLLSHCRR
jgi:hypothetical protein